MRYLGGKSRTANQIAGYLNYIRKPGQPYWEPFVGGGWILERIASHPNYASDANYHLIEMWKALQSGWIPPDTITEEQYQAIKDSDTDDALKAFVGFGCSFGGKWFGGFSGIDTYGIDHVKSNKKSLVNKINTIGNRTNFFHADFMTTEPMADKMLIYCDPPYDNTTGYGAIGDFDTNAFWNRVRKLSNNGHTVIVSEYVAPDDFSCVLEMSTKTDLHTRNGKEPRIERLFKHGKQRKFKPSIFDLF